jgi:Fe-S-cluster containining protein
MDRDETDDINKAEEQEELPEEQRAYIKKMIEKLMEKKILVVYGDEDEKDETVVFDEGGRRELCRAICCSFIFALTKKDVEKGVVKWNPKRPYFIAREEDGYCPHLDRETLMCKVWEDRPERCKNYDCRKDTNVWIDWEKKILSKDVFKHLPE